MRLFPRMSVRAKINLGIAAIVLASGMASAALVSRVAVRAMAEETRKRGVNLVRNLAVRAVDPALTRDYFALQTIVSQTAALDDSVSYVFLLGPGGGIAAHSFTGGFPTDLISANAPAPDGGVAQASIRAGSLHIIDFAAPVAVSGVSIGTARLGLSREAASAAARGLLALIGSITAVCTALALAAGSVFAAGLSRRIKGLRDFAERILEGDLEHKSAPPAQVRCWEMFHCGLSECPAYGDDRCRCWLTSGTLCARDNHKSDSCTRCKVYEANRGDELDDLSEVFSVMAFALRGHIAALNEKEHIVNRQKQLLKTVFDVTPDMVTLRDEDMRYLAANKAFCDYFGVSEGDLVGTRGEALPETPVSGPDEPGDRRILASLRPVSFEAALSRDGARLWFHIVKVPVGGLGEHDPRAIGLLTTARDISEVKAVQERLVESQKMESLGLLAGGVAHEINTPLAIILGYAQVMRDDAEQGTLLAKGLGLIEQNAKTCRKIVADLLDFSRKGEHLREPCDIGESIAEVVSLVSGIFRQERIRVVLRPAANLPPVLGDKARLGQVWMNLLTNARDAAGPDGTIVVATAFDPAANTVKVFVADSGPGIAAGDAERLFDPFFSTKPVGKGTGLGLSVSFGIVSDHGGRITATSPVPPGMFEDAPAAAPGAAYGPGALFTVELPAAPQPSA